MDVKCERCGTEYEFEDRRVTEEGVTVKCSTCGHLFKIRRKSFVLTEPVVLDQQGGDDSAGRNWMIRKSDGTILSFKELTTLQKWIVERKVSREDEISKSGETWKRLGSIAELASFFQVVDQATATLGPGLTPAGSPVTLPQTPAALGPGPATQPLPAALPPNAVPKGAALPPSAVPPSAAPMEGMQPPQATAPPGPVQSPPPATSQPPTEPPDRDPVSPAQADPAPGPSTGQFSGVGSAEPDSWGEGSYEADDDVVEKWKKHGRRKWFVIVPVFLMVIGVGVWYLAFPDSFWNLVNSVIGKTKEDAVSEAARARFQAGYTHFLMDSEEELKLALKDLDAALAETKGMYPLALAIMAEVRITRAEKIEDQILQVDAKIRTLDEQIQKLKDKGPDPGSEEGKRATELHKQKVGMQKTRVTLVDAARKDLEEAKRLISDAREKDAKAFEPKRALADYYRVRAKKRSSMEGPLKEAQALKPQDAGLLYVDGSWFAGEQASLEVAVQKLKQAIDLEPDMLRARHRLARVLIQLKKLPEAKAQLQRVLQKSPNHEQARDLLASLEPKPEPREDEKPQEAEPGKPGTHEGWMNLGEQLQNKGRTKEALGAFDKALEFKPQDVEALTGKGYCYMDMGSNLSAIKWFRKALKINSRYGAAIMGMAESYKYHGKPDQAINFYRRYLEVIPDGPEANIARRNLKELK